jgi:hypothetical protein
MISAVIQSRTCKFEFSRKHLFRIMSSVYFRNSPYFCWGGAQSVTFIFLMFKVRRVFINIRAFLFLIWCYFWNDVIHLFKDLLSFLFIDILFHKFPQQFRLHYVHCRAPSWFVCDTFGLKMRLFLFYDFTDLHTAAKLDQWKCAIKYSLISNQSKRFIFLHLLWLTVVIHSLPI